MPPRVFARQTVLEIVHSVGFEEGGVRVAPKTEGAEGEYEEPEGCGGEEDFEGKCPEEPG